MGVVVLKRLFIVWLLMAFSLILPLNAYSAVLINEIMYNPSTAQGDDSDLEWIELFNNGTQTINIENFTINGKNFDDVNITAGSLVIVARELIDGTDSDLNSFEAYYGNNDSIWNSTDAGYTAVDGDFILDNTAPADIINLSNGTYTQLVNYTPFLSLANGNGKT
ncbi:lamin tail domain-containing protein, partial [Candidatus Woesearchaeota archaeon]|nr:lamin tail domain-containing protein [Candidatus Woesearchaeota archaeon]